MANATLSLFILTCLFLSLAHVHAQIAISACGTYAFSGSYTLSGDITNSQLTCLTFTGANVQLDGGGHTIQYTGSFTGPNAAIYVQSIETITINNVHVTGQSDLAIGFYFTNVSSVTLTNNQITTATTGINFDTNVNSATLTGNTVSALRIGIQALGTGQSLTINGNTVTAPYRGLNIGTINNVTILDNTISAEGTATGSLGSGMAFSGTTSILAVNNIVTAIDTGIDAQLATSATISNNQISGASVGVSVSGNSAVSANKFTNLTTGALYCAGGGSVDVSNNLFSDSVAQYGFYLAGTNVVVSGNQFTNIRLVDSNLPNPLGCIYSSSVQGVTVEGNNFQQVAISPINLAVDAGFPVVIADNVMQDVELTVVNAVVVLAGTGSGNPNVTYNSNTINGVVKAECTGSLTVVSITSNTLTYSNSTIQNVTWTSSCNGAHPVVGVDIANDADVVIENSQVSNFACPGSTQVTGIYISSTLSQTGNVTFNNVVASNYATTNGSSITGIYVSSKGQLTFTNATISNLNAGIAYGISGGSVVGIQASVTDIFFLNSQISSLTSSTAATGNTGCINAQTFGLEDTAAGGLVMCGSAITSLAVGTGCTGLVYTVSVVGGATNGTCAALNPSNFCNNNLLSFGCDSTSCQLNSTATGICSALASSTTTTTTTTTTTSTTTANSTTSTTTANATTSGTPTTVSTSTPTSTTTSSPTATTTTAPSTTSTSTSSPSTNSPTATTTTTGKNSSSSLKVTGFFVVLASCLLALL